jgi:hypothetical protein
MYWNKFCNALDESLKAIEKRYFQIEIHTEENVDNVPVWRERAYCYELYHQLRCQLNNCPRRADPSSINQSEGIDFPYTLHGEISKDGHHKIEKIFGKGRAPNPDFVVHVPGNIYPDANLVVIEVKRSSCRKKYAQNDINKLEKFIRSDENKSGLYKHGIFLIFGSERSDNKMRDFINSLNIDTNLTSNECDTESKLCILWHKVCREEPDVVKGSFNGRRENRFFAVNNP